MSAKNILKLCFCCVLALGVDVMTSAANAAPYNGVEYAPLPQRRVVSAQRQVATDPYDGSLYPSKKGCATCNQNPSKKVRIVDGKGGDCPSCPTPEFKTKNYVFAKARYSSTVDRDCCDLASFALTNVDFKLKSEGDVYNPYSSHVGNYRFRIFGCRRASKKAMLDQGRVIQNNMDFNGVFKKSVDKCYKVMELPNVCYEDPSVILPEYVLTAEINDFFMNVCDEYDWDKAQKNNRRDGSAEMTVTWRLMNLSQTKVYWKGVTTGYAELDNGIYEGEVKLAELAFADAAARLSSLPGFEQQLMVRVSPAEMDAERAALIAFDAKFNPFKCHKPEPRPQCPMAKPICPCAMQQPCVCTQPMCSCPVVQCPCAVQQFQAAPKIEEFVDVKTEKTVIEKKIITTTRVETPQPVCQQVCQPVCPQPTCQVKCTRSCEKPKCRRICTKVCVEGTDQCTETCKDDCEQVPEPKVEEITYTPVIEQKGEVEVKNEVIEPQIEEKGGVTETHRVYENCIDENGNVITDGSCITPSWVDFATVDSKLCIVDRAPYSELSPENMLKIRGSVVEITNAFNKKGSGLLISDSFILTSADLVNKNQNTYDVKLLNGQVVKAKAVRVNPSKNIALMHMDKPVAYTPLSLNTNLPAIDQEGFIALGDLSNTDAKNYMDDSGKIYGYHYSETQGTEIIVDTLVQKVSTGSVLIDKLGTVNGISNAGKQTKDGMDIFMPTDTALRSVGLTICEKIYDKTPAKPITEMIKQETKAPEAMPEKKRK